MSLHFLCFFGVNYIYFFCLIFDSVVYLLVSPFLSSLGLVKFSLSCISLFLSLTSANV